MKNSFYLSWENRKFYLGFFKGYVWKNKIEKSLYCPVFSPIKYNCASIHPSINHSVHLSTDPAIYPSGSTFKP